jgi:hypothetical protein
LAARSENIFNMKRLLPWSNLSLEELQSLYENAELKSQLDGYKQKVFFPPKFPKACFDSQDHAMQLLIVKCLGYKRKDNGGGTLGDIPYDADHMFLMKVESAGSVFAVRGLLPYIRNLWESDSPYQSEAQLNRFLIRLGRALATKKKRKIDTNVPDWLHNVDQTERFIVEGWCKRIVVDGEQWPPLCCFTTPALVKFLRLCNVKHCKLGKKNSRTIEKAIQRLGLVRIPRGRVNFVEKRLGQFFFG